MPGEGTTKAGSVVSEAKWLLCATNAADTVQPLIAAEDGEPGAERFVAPRPLRPARQDQERVETPG